MKTPAKKLTLSITATMLLALACIQAQAQSGSRLCGYVALKTSTKIGLLYESDSSDFNKCKDAISRAMDIINKDPQLKAMEWQRVQQDVCQKVGDGAFTEIAGNPDICDTSMVRGNTYKITKKGDAKVIYEKQ